MRSQAADGRQEADGRGEAALSRGRGLRRSRSTRRAPSPKASRKSSRRSLIAIVLVIAGRLPLPARLARHADSAARRAGFADRNVRASSRCSASPSTRFRCSAWCWRSAWWWTTPSSSWKRVERHIEEGMSPKDAAFKAMEEISGPVVGIALVLSAVFVPTAFIPGITGRLYQQFAVTIAISVILSAFNALTLSPALAALLLRPKTESRGPAAGSSSTGSTACLGAPPTAMSRWCGGADSQERASRSCCWWSSASRRVSSAAECRPASCRTKIRATSIVNLQLPNAASLQRTDAGRDERSRRSWRIRRASNTPPASSASACSALCAPATTPSSSSR